nr:hypothetical protein [Tanacetum cinerariifolium]
MHPFDYYDPHRTQLNLSYQLVTCFHRLGAGHLSTASPTLRTACSFSKHATSFICCSTSPVPRFIDTTSTSYAIPILLQHHELLPPLAPCLPHALTFVPATSAPLSLPIKPIDLQRLPIVAPGM